MKTPSAKQTSPLNAMLGKKVVFQGKFDRGERDRLAEMTEAQQGAVAEDLDAKIDFLVLADATGGATIKKKANALNAKGANIQIVDRDTYLKLAEPTQDQVLTLIRGGKQNAVLLKKAMGSHARNFNAIVRGNQSAMPIAFVGETFDGLDLSGFQFTYVRFEKCSFNETNLSSAVLWAATNCDFTKANLNSCTLVDVSGSRFCGARLEQARFNAAVENADFSDAVMNKAAFIHARRGATSPVAGGVRFCRAKLDSAMFRFTLLNSADFSKADLTGAVFRACELEHTNFQSAILRNAVFDSSKLIGANFTRAIMNRADFADSDLTAAQLDGADLDGATFCNSKLDRVDFQNAKNYTPQSAQLAAVGPALTELDGIAQQARSVHFEFQVQRDNEDAKTVGIDTRGLKYGWGVSLPRNMPQPTRLPTMATVSAAMQMLVNRIGQWNVKFETVTVSSTKSPKVGKELREIVTKAISEAFSQPLPPADELAAALKAYRATLPGYQQADRVTREEAKRQREQEKLRQEQEKQKELKKIEKTIQKKVGKVGDIASFLKALEIRADVAKIDKATKMLKADRFKLFNDVTDTHLNGVVKSQTDADLVYACRIESSGAYACCTQNLNVCGGLRGSICKHLLVLIIGLVQAGELDPTTIDSWISKTHGAKSELNKETMGEIFIRYKGAEAGEVDWRPTETVPEDYYAV